jgi:hypothetical protein
MTDFAFLQLVLAKSQSVEQAAARYGCSLRTIRSFKGSRGMATKQCRDCPMGINRLRPICKTERPRLGGGSHSNSHAPVVGRWRKHLEATVSRAYRCIMT